MNNVQHGISEDVVSKSEPIIECPKNDSNFEMWVLINKEQKQLMSNAPIKDAEDQSIEFDIAKTDAVDLSEQMNKDDQLESALKYKVNEQRKNNIFHILNIRPGNGLPQDGPILCSKPKDLEDSSKGNGNLINNSFPLGNKNDVSTTDKNTCEKLSGPKQDKPKKSVKNSSKAHSSSTPISLVTIFFPRVNLLSKMV